MTEQQLCEFVEKWNDSIESSGFEHPVRYVDWLTPIVDVLDDLMHIFNGNLPKWVEESATAKDGTVYYVRYQWNKPYCQSVKRRLEIQATNRAQHIANTR